LPYIDERLLKLIDRFPQFKTSNLINQFGQNWSWDHFDQSFDDTINMGEELGIPKILSLILACNNLRSLKQLHDKLAVKINEKECSNTPLIYYTEPPVRGNEFVIPITNNHALMNEGTVQHNCVASYHNRIILRKYYVYKILKPERATLGLKLKEGKFHSIDQIKICFNSDVSKKTLEQVEEWLIMSKIVI
ncbi:PcfJ domain-containing protein, partial [Oleiphilus sp. HI0132]|uniref:PcfJ domain-containing protein n=1 Tax=Oleiphilus sp. HI0132 TaxID=1822270 RepID=UPI000A8830BF